MITPLPSFLSWGKPLLSNSGVNYIEHAPVQTGYDTVLPLNDTGEIGPWRVPNHVDDDLRPGVISHYSMPVSISILP
jgi:hypothetical protein